MRECRFRSANTAIGIGNVVRDIKMKLWWEVADLHVVLIHKYLRQVKKELRSLRE